LVSLVAEHEFHAGVASDFIDQLKVQQVQSEAILKEVTLKEATLKEDSLNQAHVAAND